MPLLEYHEIDSLQDVLYDAWLDLYQTAFSLAEQVQVSALNRILRRKEGQGHNHLLAGLDEKQFVALAWYEISPDCDAGVLWYLAVDPSRRSQGLGGQVYAEIRRRIAAEHPRARVLLFEVEDPRLAHAPAERALAQRRIEFYRRQGCRLLDGICYRQSVGWQPPLQMRLMADLYQEMSAEDVFEAAQCLFGEALQRTGPVSLE